MAVAKKQSSSKPDQIALSQVDADAEGVIDDVQEFVSDTFDDIHDFVKDVFDGDKDETAEVLAVIEGEAVELEEEEPLFMPLEPVEPAPGLKPLDSEGRYPQPTESILEAPETYEAVVDQIIEMQDSEESIPDSNSTETIVQKPNVKA